MIENYIKDKLSEKELLLMTHIVIGYPTLEASYDLVSTMVKSGVDLMELQIPFSEPTADGPVILKASQEALASGITVNECFQFGERAAGEFGIPFIFMTYYNILFKYGVGAFAERMRKSGLQGAIVPDLPPEEGGEYLEEMKKRELDPIFIFSPNTPPARMRYISDHAGGLVYCVARKGVTGSKTDFSNSMSEYLGACRQATSLPLALGFGVKERSDVDFLKGKVDIAVVGSQTIRLMEEGGLGTVEDFIRDLNR